MLKDQQNIKNKIKLLAIQIQQYDKAYYEQNKSLISDEEYDLLKKKYLKSLEQYSGNIHSINNVGSPITNTSKKIQHIHTMLSLQNAYNLNDMQSFMDSLAKQNIKTNFIGELKIDGIAFAAQYINGILHTASTRGDGKIGEDITQNILMIKNFPYILKEKFSGEIYGEIYMDKHTFQKTQQQFANPRNTASGTIRMLNPLTVKSRNLQYFAYNLKMKTEIDNKTLPDQTLDNRHLDNQNSDHQNPNNRNPGNQASSNKASSNKASSNTNLQIHTQSNALQTLQKLGFIINNTFKTLANLEEIEEFYQYCISIRDQLNYEIDGLVCKVNDRSLYQKIGITNKFPKYAIAYKFPANQKFTQITSIDYQTGRTGIITPIANLNPINIHGVIVKRCTLHNFHEILINDIHINDYVYIQRSGDVIPKILGVMLNKRPSNIIKIIPPTQCPTCNSSVKKESIYIRCINNNCSSILENQIKLFVSKQGFNIAGFAENHIKLFIKYNLIKTHIDIFYLSKHKEKILLLEGWNKKSLQNLLQNIEQARKITLEKFISALGIRHIGKNNAMLIAKTCKSINNFITINAEKLSKINGLGEKCIQSILEYLSTNKEQIDALLKHIIIENPINSSNSTNSLDSTNNQTSSEAIKRIKNSIFYNKNICITGTLSNMSRDKAFTIIKKLGGTPSTSITTKTNILIYTNHKSSKYQKASKMPDITLLNEQEFFTQIKTLREITLL